jgi:hypothetical protein
MRRPDVALLTHHAAGEEDVHPVLSASQSGTNVCAVRLLLPGPLQSLPPKLLQHLLPGPLQSLPPKLLQHLLPGPLHLPSLVGIVARSAAQQALHAQVR